MRFVLNDETKVNSYGFRVLNKGIDLTRFRENPVMLNEHNRENHNVIGRWRDIRIEGHLLTAVPEFDMNDTSARLIADKVEQGFIKGCSIGFKMNGGFTQGRDGIPVVERCELLECSICAIPSNAGALRLYAANGKQMAEKTVKLSISKFLNDKPMDLLQSLIELLKLDPNSTEEDVLNAIQAIFDEKQSKDTKEAETAVLAAVRDGRINASAKEFYMTAAKSDLAGTIKALNAIPKRVSLYSRLKLGKNPSIEDRTEWTLGDWRQKAPRELAENPKMYQELLEREHKNR